MPDIMGPFQRLNPRERRTFTLPNGDTATGNFLFDPTVFRTVFPSGPEEARLGNLGRNVFSGPGVNVVDFSLLKRFVVTERQSVELRVDTTNVFNHATFGFGGFSTAWGDFGQTRSTYGPRRIQLYLRYNF